MAARPMKRWLGTLADGYEPAAAAEIDRKEKKASFPTVVGPARARARTRGMCIHKEKGGGTCS